MFPRNKEFDNYIKTKKNINGKIYIILKENIPLKALIIFKKTNDFFVQQEGYSPVLNLDDFEIPETEESESENLEQ